MRKLRSKADGKGQKEWYAILTSEVREHLAKLHLSKDIKEARSQVTWKFGGNVFQAEGLDSAKSYC